MLMTPEPVRHKTGMASTPHILVVEDDREISALVARYLQANECRVSVADDGRAMDRVLAESRIDLIVLDLMLPGEDGLSLCHRLRRRLGRSDRHADGQERRDRPHHHLGNGRARLPA